MSNYIPLFYVDAITHPYPNYDAGTGNKRGPRSPVRCPYNPIHHNTVIHMHSNPKGKTQIYFELSNLINH